MSDLTTRQQRIARTLGHHALRELAYPGQGVEQAKGQQGGGSYDLDGVSGWYQTTPRGRGWAPDLRGFSSSPSAYDVFVSWTDLRDHLTPLARQERVERVQSYLRRAIEHQLAGPTYPGRWRGVPFVVPRNGKGETHEDCERYWRDVHMPEYRALRLEEAALLDELFPATAANAEPLDLLELLEAGG